MALVKCPECDKEISDTTDVCIHCGYKINETNKQNTTNCLSKKGILIVIILLVILIIVFLNNKNENDTTESLVSCDDLSHFIDKAKTSYAKERGYNVNLVNCRFFNYIKYTDTGEHAIDISCESPNKLYSKDFKYKCKK